MSAEDAGSKGPGAVFFILCHDGQQACATCPAKSCVALAGELVGSTDPIKKNTKKKINNIKIKKQKTLKTNQKRCRLCMGHFQVARMQMGGRLLRRSSSARIRAA